MSQKAARTMGPFLSLPRRQAHRQAKTKASVRSGQCVGVVGAGGWGVGEEWGGGMWVRAAWEKLGTLAGGGPLEGPSPWALRPLFNAQAPNPSWASCLHIGGGDPILDMWEGGWELNRIPRALCCVLEAEVDTAVPLLQLSKEMGMTLHEGLIPPIQAKRGHTHTHTHTHTHWSRG